MNTQDIEQLFAYDRWANRRVLEASSKLTPEQFTRDLGNSFPSVRDTLVHILRGQWMWLNYWKSAEPGPAIVDQLRQRSGELCDPARFPDIATVRQQCGEIEKELAEFIGGLTDEGLQRLLPVKGTDLRLVELLQHLANHSTYHRGQVITLLRQLGAEVVSTDFHMFLAEQKAAGAGA